MLEPQARVAEERRGKFRRSTDAAQAAVQRPAEGRQVRRADVPQLAGFHIAPNLLDGIQLRGISRQAFDAQPPPLARQIRPHPPTLVRAQAVPDQAHPLPPEVALERPEKRDEPGVGVGVGAGLEEEADGEPVPAKRQRPGHGQALPVAAGRAQDGRLAAGRPRAADDGLLRDPAFVLEDEPGAAPAGVFFTWGQPSLPI